MSDFFSDLSSIFGFLNTFYIIGNISVLHVLMMVLTVGIIVKLLKGRK